MKNIIKNLLAVCTAVVLFTSCNKELEQFPAIATPTYPSGTGLAATLAANPNFSFFNALITRAGMASLLNDSTKTFTLFATDNTGMKIFVNAASGGAVPLTAPDATFLGFISTSLPVASAQGILSYNTVGTKFLAASFPTTFANYPLPSQIILDPTQPFVRMPIFPSKRPIYAYVNNIPLTAVDIPANNGVIHTSYTIVAPPSATLKTMIASEPTLSYFRAAVARADSGSVGTSRFDSLMNYGVTNMTVLAPNDAAMQPLLFGALYQGLYQTVYNSVYNTAYNTAIAAGATVAVAQSTATTAANAQTPTITASQATSLASTPAGFNYLPVSNVRGIIAYHILATNASGSYIPGPRTFSVNYSNTPTLVKTLVNASVSIHPGILSQATFSGSTVSALTFTGYGTFPSGGAPFSAAPVSVVKMDNHAVNGVYHIINGVLLPQ